MGQNKGGAHAVLCKYDTYMLFFFMNEPVTVGGGVGLTRGRTGREMY